MKSDWKASKIKDFADVRGGKRLPKGKSLSTTPNKHPYIRIRDLGKSKILELNSDYEYVDDETQLQISRYTVDEDDILISVVGTIGLIGIVGHSLNKANLTENCDKIVNLKGINKDYLYYYLISQMGQDEIKKGTVGAVQPKLPLKNVLDINVLHPDILVQREIVNILNVLDKKIETNIAINQNLEQQMDGLYNELFVTRADASWKTGTIADLGDVVGGGTPSKKVDAYYTEHGIAWVTPKDLSLDHSKFFSHGGIDITNLGLAKSSATLLPTGTVLFTSRAPIGYISIASNELCTNQGFKSVVPHENIGTAYVYCFLKANLSVIENMASGSTFKEVSGNTMKSVPAMLPDDGTLAYFNSFAMPFLQQQRNLESENHRLSTLRDTLLPRLMSGELDVSAINI